MNRLSFLLLLLSACASLVAAALAPTFCKCTCFTNSTIIEIKSTTSGAIVNSHAAESPSDLPTTLGENLELEFPHLFNDSPRASARTTDDGHNGGALSRAATKRASLPSPSCSQCNRAFCLRQSLPICKGAAETDVTTSCFQRDSRKDQVIVWGFLLGTAGLLGWAAVRKGLEMRGRPGGVAEALLGGAGGGGVGGGGGGRRASVPMGRSDLAAAGGGAGGRRAVAAGVGGGTTGNDGGRVMYAGVAEHGREHSPL